MEDNRADIHLIRDAIAASQIPSSVQVVRDGEQATDVFDKADREEAAACPDLVILDINLPKKEGSQVLAHLRQSRRCRDTRVVVVSTSSIDPSRPPFGQLGVNAFFQKPSSYQEFLKLGEVIRSVFAS